MLGTYCHVDSLLTGGQEVEVQPRRIRAQILRVELAHSMYLIRISSVADHEHAWAGCWMQGLQFGKGLEGLHAV